MNNCSYVSVFAASVNIVRCGGIQAAAGVGDRINTEAAAVISSAMQAINAAS